MESQLMLCSGWHKLIGGAMSLQIGMQVLVLWSRLQDLLRLRCLNGTPVGAMVSVPRLFTDTMCDKDESSFAREVLIVGETPRRFRLCLQEVSLWAS